MDTYDQDKNIQDENDTEYEYSPDPIINDAIKEGVEGKDIAVSMRFGNREIGFRTKKKLVRTWDNQFKGFIPEDERKYQKVCKIHQLHIKYNRQTNGVEIWNNAVRPGERLGMVQEHELVKAMFDLMQYFGVKLHRERKKQSYRAYIPKHLVKIARFDKQAISDKESWAKFRPQNEPKSEKMISNINNNYNHSEVQKVIDRNLRLIREWKKENREDAN
jgi:hypothetical protein